MHDSGELLDVDCHDLKGREEMVLSPGDDEGMIDNSETALSGDLNWSVISSSTRVTAGMKSWASLHPSEPMIMTSNSKNYHIYTEFLFYLKRGGGRFTCIFYGQDCVAPPYREK